MTQALPAAVFWDMDGTLVDTEPYWMQAETELVSSFGGTWTHDDGLALVGSGLWASAKVFQSRGVDMPADDIVAHLTDRVQEQLEVDGAPWRPGARELLLQLHEASVPMALVTMSVRRMAEQIVATIPFDAFRLLVTGDEVELPKPHPEPYLNAARQLSVDPRDCIAIEDSLNGLASAVAAGMITIGVPHMIPLPTTAEHTVWPTLENRGYPDLVALATSIAASRTAGERTR